MKQSDPKAWLERHIQRAMSEFPRDTRGMQLAVLHARRLGQIDPDNLLRFAQTGHLPVGTADDPIQGMSLFVQPKSPKWSVSINLPGTGRIKKATPVRFENTGTASEPFYPTLGKALVYAGELRAELELRAERGEPIRHIDRSLGEALLEYAAHLGTKPQTKTLENTIWVLKRHIRFWNEIKLSELSETVWEDFLRWRLVVHTELPGRVTYKRAGRKIEAAMPRKAPAFATLQREKTVLRQFFYWLMGKKYIIAGSVPPMSLDVAKRLMAGTRKRNTRRSDIAPEYVDKMNDLFDQWIGEKKTKYGKREFYPKEHYYRVMLALYCRLMLATGLRPGGESNALRFNQLELITHPKGATYILHIPQVKTKARDVVAFSDIVATIEQLKRHLADYGKTANPDDYLFQQQSGPGLIADFSKGFAGLIETLGIPKSINSDGGLTPYSLRHTYITGMLKRGIPTAGITASTGTSSAMIDKHYGHVRPMDQINQLAGWS